jgi:predicted RNA-binding protein YlxR (DUF448 family)
VKSALAIREDDETAHERKCIVTGKLRDRARLIRFVVSPDGEVTPDLAAKLPGRGMWVSADRKSLEQAVAKNHFSKAAKANVKASADLAARVEKLIVRRMSDDLGMARRSGALVCGFDNVVRELDGAKPPAALVEASDGAADGRRKLVGSAKSRGLDLPVIDVLTCEEISLALGRENVIHAALKSGPLAERLIFEAGRLSGLRNASGKHAGPIPADEGIE